MTDELPNVRVTMIKSRGFRNLCCGGLARITKDCVKVVDLINGEKWLYPNNINTYRKHLSNYM